MNPITIALPLPIITDRLIIRAPEKNDAQACYEAEVESHESLKVWLPWAFEKPSLMKSVESNAKAMADLILRKDLRLYIIDKNSGKFLGCSGLHRIDWSVPKFEIGYWIRDSEKNKGIITESTKALTDFAFRHLKANRVEIIVDSENFASRRVPEKLGYQLEGILRKCHTLPYFTSMPRHKAFYSMIS